MSIRYTNIVILKKRNGDLVKKRSWSNEKTLFETIEMWKKSYGKQYSKLELSIEFHGFKIQKISMRNKISELRDILKATCFGAEAIEKANRILDEIEIKENALIDEHNARINEKELSRDVKKIDFGVGSIFYKIAPESSSYITDLMNNLKDHAMVTSVFELAQMTKKK